MKTCGQEKEAGRTVEPQTVAGLKSGADPGCLTLLAHRLHFLLLGCESVTSSFSELPGPLSTQVACPWCQSAAEVPPGKHPLHTTEKAPCPQAHLGLSTVSISWVVSMLTLPVLSPEFHHQPGHVFTHEPLCTELHLWARPCTQG